MQPIADTAWCYEVDMRFASIRDTSLLLLSSLLSLSLSLFSVILIRSEDSSTFRRTPRSDRSHPLIHLVFHPPTWIVGSFRFTSDCSISHILQKNIRAPCHWWFCDPKACSFIRKHKYTKAHSSNRRVVTLEITFRERNCFVSLPCGLLYSLSTVK